VQLHGHEGRIAIYEVMPVGEELRDAILKNARPPNCGRSRSRRHEEPAQAGLMRSLKELRLSRKC